MPTPPTSSNNIVATSPTKEAVDSVFDKKCDNKHTSQETKKIEKEVGLEKIIPDRMPSLRNDKDVETKPCGVKENVCHTTEQGDNNEKLGEKTTDDDDTLSLHNTFMDIVIR